MGCAYVVGQFSVKDESKWEEYRAQVPATIDAFGGMIVFRGEKERDLAGGCSEEGVVVIKFPDMDALNNWYASAMYQALIPLRQEASAMTLTAYKE
ncbi:MAG: DUF1330 domain-containing protein [Pseudomonas sp.]|uniref:DUF1330 domain-containing protein n=1 Tax=Pseudomonas sp. TaxID=306 RepID=UPI003D10253C